MHKTMAVFNNIDIRIIVGLLHFPAPLYQIEPSGPG